VTRPRAADDFATIRARRQELRRERAQAPFSETEKGAEGPQPLRAAERRLKERREGWPPPWVPTIFIKKRVEL
jgi:hypothetical protein